MSVGWLGAAGAVAAGSAAPPATDWLSQVNFYRQAAGLSPVSEDTHASGAAAQHARYLVFSGTGGIETHEDAASAAYSAAGDAVARGGHIENMDTAQLTSVQEFVESWVSDPYTQLALLDPTLTTVGFGHFAEAGHSHWASAAVLSLVGHSAANARFPVTFPANGAVESLASMPDDPLGGVVASCLGYSAPTGLPITVQLSGDATVSGAHLSQDGRPLDACLLTATSYRASGDAVASDRARATLEGAHAVVLVPRLALDPDRSYQVSLMVDGKPLQWSFGVSRPFFVTPTTAPLGTPAPARQAALGTSNRPAKRTTRSEVALIGMVIAGMVVWRGVGPRRRRVARSTVAIGVGVWVATAVDHDGPLVAPHPSVLGWAALFVAGVTVCGLLASRVLRMSRGTWRPKPGAFDVVPSAKKY